MKKCIDLGFGSQHNKYKIKDGVLIIDGMSFEQKKEIEPILMKICQIAEGIVYSAPHYDYLVFNSDKTLIRYYNSLDKTEHVIDILEEYFKIKRFQAILNTVKTI